MKISLKPTKFDAVCELVGHGISGDDNATDINYRGKTPASQSDIDAKYAEMIKAWNDSEYQRDRATSYPSIQEQLDMQYWDAVNGTKKWQEAVAKVKTDNPKPE